MEAPTLERILNTISASPLEKASSLGKQLNLSKKQLNPILYKLLNYGFTEKNELNQWSLTEKGISEISTISASKPNCNAAVKHEPNAQTSRMNNNPEVTAEDSSRIKESIEKLREELLDLTRRNSLINVNYSRGKKYLHIVDELPSQICSALLEQKEFSFDCVSDPTDKELETWRERENKPEGDPTLKEVASWHNILLDYDLAQESREGVDRRHTDYSLQTPYFAKELEARLKTIKSFSDLQIQETGMNTLYLTIGYLEWFEISNQDRACLSPLFSLPVTLTKGKLDKKTKTYKYTLAWSGEDLITNISLVKRLERDFDFVIPPLSSDGEGNIIEIEEYLTLIAETINEAFPQWSVLRRCTLSFLNFAKLLMYNDLDTEKWSELLTHSLVRDTILGSEQERGSVDSTFLSEHDIDSIKDLHVNYPLVDSADSSQHSAIIHALTGKNLVIEGPPGTGKSQTITNLIAGLLGQGKSVLFVSEKMAALSVVKDRLENLGLSDFLLELHSHSTKKQGVIESFKKRLNRKPDSNSEAINRIISKTEKLKEKLNKHAKLINTKWKDTDLAIVDIFSAYTLENESAHADLKEVAQNLAIDKISTPFDRDELYRQAETLRLSAKQTSEVCEDNDISLHPWYGINSGKLTSVDKPQVLSLLANWQAELKLVNQVIDSIDDFTSENIQVSYNDIIVIRKFIDSFPDTNEISWSLFTSALESDDNLLLIQETAQKATILNKQLSNLAYELHIDQLTKVTEFDQHSLLDEAHVTGIDPKLPISSLLQLEGYLSNIKKQTEVISSILQEYEYFCESSIPSELKPNEATIPTVENFRSVCEFVSQNKSALDYRNEKFLTEEVLDQVKLISKKLKAYDNQKSKLTTYYVIEDLPSLNQLSAMSSILEDASLLKRIFSKDHRNLIQSLRVRYKGGKQNFKSVSPIAHVKELEKLERARVTYEAELDKCDIDISKIFKFKISQKKLDATLTLHSIILKDFGENEGRLFTSFKLNDLGRWLIHAPKDKLLALENFAKSGLFDSTQSLKRSIDSIEALSSWEEVYFADSSKIHELTNRQVFRSLKTFSGNLQKATSHELVFEEQSLLESLTEIKKVDQLKVVVSDLFEDCGEFNNSLTNPIDLDNTPLSKICNLVSKTEKALNSPVLSNHEFELSKKILLAAITESTTPEGFAKFKGWGTCLDVARLKADKSLALFDEAVDFNLSDWLGGQESSLPMMIEYCQISLDAGSDFVPYALYLQAKSILSKLVDPVFVDIISTNTLDARDVRSTCRLGIMRSYIKEIFREHEGLRSFQGLNHESFIDEFKRAHETLFKLQRLKVASDISSKNVPAGNKGYYVSEHTEKYLIRRETEKKTKHIPIRQLLKRAPKAAQGLKPCFMMGPRSVAQYLTPEKLKFDVLIIDEASQLKPAEAIGACARASQIIVVGDSKQLPPTTFFDGVTPDDGGMAVAENESILDAARGANIPSRILRWHYRSQHESLINFSNQKFYENELELFPSPQKQSSEYGIEHFYIENGLFENQQNKAEAIAIAERVEFLILRNSKVSLGVATMNSKQRDLIEGYIDQLAKNNPLFDTALAENRECSEALFIKNLETVQGDERDVIIISFTYGRGLLGSPAQRFGPINGATGWRRLNVLFTRSRVRMEAFTSMHHGDVKTTESSSRGVHALKEFLHYAETGHLSASEKTERPADSDFEVGVAYMLKLHGYSCDFQVGVSGFFIDLAVQHPLNPNRHIMGIECDGATYHSSKTARDRDCLRQGILESLGWEIRRLWSTDWFNQPEQSMKSILSELKELSAKPIIDTKEQTWKPSKQDNSDIQYEDSNNNNENKSSEETPIDSETEMVNIEIQDSVSIHYKDTDECQTFIIIYGNAHDSSGKLNYQAPLARLLMQAPVNPNGGLLQFIDREITITSVTKPNSD